MNPSPVVIKKYGNRRLYDTAGSRYVNLEDIAALIREGRELKVVDAKTGQELWAAKLGKVANANPMTYQGKNGKQYVAIMATDSLVVFALP